MMGVKVMGWKDFYWWHLWIECRHSHSYRQCFSYHLTGMMSVHVGVHVRCPSSKFYSSFFLQWNHTATSCSTTLSPFLLLKPKWAHRKLSPLSFLITVDTLFWSGASLFRFGWTVAHIAVRTLVRKSYRYNGIFQTTPICIRYLYTGTQPYFG